MLYQLSQTIPPNTPEDNPISQRIDIPEPYLVRLYLHIPPGVHSLAGVRIKVWDWQVFPQRKFEFFKADDLNLWFDIGYASEGTPVPVIFEFCNLDDTFDHTIRLLLQAETYMPGVM